MKDALPTELQLQRRGLVMKLIYADDDVSRRLIACRNIRANEVIVVEDAVVVAPTPNSTPVCPTCLKKIGSDDNKCPKCQMAVCEDPECVNDPIHGSECRWELVKVSFRMCCLPSTFFYLHLH